MNKKMKKGATVVVLASLVTLALTSWMFIPTILADEGTITMCSYLDDALYSPFAIWYNDSIYVFGGFNSSSGAGNNKVWGHNVTTNTTNVVDTMVENVYCAAGVLDTTNTSGYGDCVWIFGGCTSPGAGTDIIQCFTFSNESCWDIGADLPTVIYGLGRHAIIDSDSICWIFGGNRGPVEQYCDDVMCYNSSNNTAWKEDELTYGRVNPDVVFNSSSGIAYILGGRISSTEWTDDITAYNLSNLTDYHVGDMNHAKNELATIWDNVNDTIIIGGGGYKVEETWYYLTEIERFNPSTASCKVINNLTKEGYCTVGVWDDINKMIYFVCGYESVGGAYKDIHKLDLGLIGEEPEIQFISIDGGVNGTTTYNATPTFNWTVVSGASTYRLQIANNSDFAPAHLVVNLSDINVYNYPSNYAENATRVSFTIPNALTLSGTYYCRVKAYVKGGN